MGKIKITYGLYSEFEKGRPHYEVELEQEEADELWSRVATTVNLGLMHWKNEKVK